jgi:hypothetical protein
MQEKNNSPIVPEQIKGKSVDLEESMELDSVKEAKEVFNRAAERLFHPLSWHELAGTLSAFFKPDKSASSAGKKIKEGDYLMIDLPAPKPAAGDGHDWVRVISVSRQAEKDAEESAGVTVAASVNPHQPEEGVAHFFDEDATSSFIIKRQGNKVTASYHGRNEKPNTSDVSTGDKIRNSIVAVSAMAGLSELQWKSLLKGFLK